MTIADQHPDLIKKIADDSGRPGTPDHRPAFFLLGYDRRAGPQRSLIVNVTDPAMMLVAGEDGRYTGGLAVSEEPPSMAVKAFAAGVEQRGGSSSTATP